MKWGAQLSACAWRLGVLGIYVCHNCLYVTKVTFRHKTKTSEWIMLFFSEIVYGVPRSYPVKYQSPHFFSSGAIRGQIPPKNVCHNSDIA